MRFVLVIQKYPLIILKIVWRTLIVLQMSQRYRFKCVMTTQKEQDILHIEVKNKSFSQEVYFNHFCYKELPEFINDLFGSVAKLYTYLNKPGTVYFDDVDVTLNVCIPIGNQIKQLPLPLSSRGRVEGINHQIGVMEQQQARLQDEFQVVKMQKERQMEEINDSIRKQMQKKEYLQRKGIQMAEIYRCLNKEVAQLQKICAQKEQKIASINQFGQFRNKKVEKQEYLTSMMKGGVSEKRIKQNISEQIKVDGERSMTLSQRASFPFEISQLSKRKIFWIREIGLLRAANAAQLKALINSQTNFNKQIMICLQSIQLKKMTFVEIFTNLEILDLSDNQIKEIQGLNWLTNLRKLNLSNNQIQTIKGLTHNKLLNELDLAHNKIKCLENIFHLSHLRVISLGHNLVQEVPKKIYKLSRLTELYMNYNYLKTISENMVFLKYLKIFSVVGNQFYKERNEGKLTLDRLMSNGVKTVINNSK